MPREIERKFLILETHPGFIAALRERPSKITQGYIHSDSERTVRVRRLDDQGFLTIKGKKVGISADEYEYEIPLEEALSMLEDMCRTVLHKERRFIPFGDELTIELDYFPQTGLYLAEVELPSVEHAIVAPDWFGAEVSDDPAYSNSVIAEQISLRA